MSAEGEEVPSIESFESSLDGYIQAWYGESEADGDLSSDDLVGYFDHCFKLFGLSSNTDYTVFETNTRKYIRDLTLLRRDYVRCHGAESDEIEEKFNRIFQAVYYSRKTVAGALFLRETLNSTYKTTSEPDSALFRFTPVDTENNSAYQNLILYVLGEICDRQYRRYNGEVYEKVVTAEGYDTHSWRMIYDKLPRKMSSLKKLVYELCQSQISFQQWHNLTASKDNDRAIVNYLQSYEGPEFPDIEKCRNVFSFRNGVYLAGIDKFYLYEVEQVCTSLVAAKFFDLPFTVCEGDWFESVLDRCPNFLKIMEYQKWPRDVMKWLCIMLGRCLYEVGEKDGWQVVPYLLGQANSGKSTLITQVLKQFYDSTDVGVLSNNIETTFGIGALVNKFLYIAPEIKTNCKLEQAEFQSLVSGEDVQVAEKHVTATTTKWTVPGAFAGNEVPGYADANGSVARRLLVFKFVKKVKKGDTKLGEKLAEEIPDILQACNKGYLEKIAEIGDDNVWTRVPKYFRCTREEMSENTNSLMHFLKSEKIRLGEGLYCPEKHFKQVFTDHCRENSLGSSRWVSDFFMGPFETCAIVQEKAARMRYPNFEGARVLRANFLMGCDLMANLEDGGHCSGFEDPEER